MPVLFRASIMSIGQIGAWFIGIYIAAQIFADTIERQLLVAIAVQVALAFLVLPVIYEALFKPERMPRVRSFKMTWSILALGIVAIVSGNLTPTECYVLFFPLLVLFHALMLWFPYLRIFR